MIVGKWVTKILYIREAGESELRPSSGAYLHTAAPTRIAKEYQQFDGAVHLHIKYRNIEKTPICSAHKSGTHFHINTQLASVTILCQTTAGQRSLVYHTPLVEKITSCKGLNVRHSLLRSAYKKREIYALSLGKWLAIYLSF